MPPAVSVIVPNYNHAPYLRERIDSILQQTFTSYELILLDDCSTDNSRSILGEYAGDPHVTHTVYNDKNSGCTFAQWKRGLALASGKYVWIAESDDYADKEFLGTLVGQLESHPEAVLAFSGSEIVDAMSTPIPGADWDRFGARADTVQHYTGRQLIERKLLRNCLIYNASMAIFRRDAAPEITDEFLRMKLCGDWLFWSRLARKGDAVEVCRKLNRFRQHKCKVSSWATAQGRTYTEGLPVVLEMAAWLKLTPLQRKVIAGRIAKRLRKFPGILKENPTLDSNLKELAGVIHLYPSLLEAVYETDKYLHFSGLAPEARG